MSEVTKPASVVTGVTVEKHEFLWKIQNFAVLPKEGRPLETQKFEIHAGKNSLWQSKWIVGLKNNVREDGEKCYHVYCKLEELLSVDGTDKLQSHFTVQLRDQNGATYWTTELHGFVKVGECLEVDQRCWWEESTDWKNFIDTDGAVNIFIKLSLLEPFSACDDNIDKKMLEKHLKIKSAMIAQKNLARLRAGESSEFDVKIVCNNGKEFKCHKAILMANSPLLRVMLQSDFAEFNCGVINVTDISEKTMDILLQYLYTGELLPTWCDPDVIVEFTHAAGKYQIAELLEFLDNMLGRASSDKDAVTTSLPLLNLAQNLSLIKAKGQLLDRIAKLAVSSKSSTDMLSLFYREN